MFGSFNEKRAGLKKLEAAADSRFRSNPQQHNSAPKRASFKAQDAAAASRQPTTASTDFKARPLPKQSNAATPAAMKARRKIEEKERQAFRNKVEAFYQSKPELQSKWEKARDVLLVKYATGSKWKQFNAKLVEKYGSEFELFQASENVIQVSNEDGRVACGYCDRRFVLSRVFEHEQICANLKHKGLRRKVGRKSQQRAGGTYQKRQQASKDEGEGEGDAEAQEEEDVVDEGLEIAQASAALEQKLAGMSEIEQLEYQLSQMKRLQSMKQ